MLLEPEKVAQIQMQLPGIEVASVLQSTGLDWQIFQRILVGFFQDNTETIDKIHSAQAANDTATLLRMAHKLKGSAANIGAQGVQKTADALEMACGMETTPAIVADLIHNLLRELADLMQQLKPLSDQIDNVELAVTVNEPESDPVPLLETLAQVIERADPQKIEGVSAEIKKQLVGRKNIDQSLLKILDIQIRRYDYDQALQTIGQLLGQLRHVLEEN